MEGKKEMKKKIFYIILVCIIIAGAVIIGTQGLEVDIVYSKNVRIDIYLGKTFENNDIKQIAQEVFETNRVLVQQVELYGDMVSITVKEENAENIDEKLEQLNTKINEKYELENKVDDIEVTHQPKVRLSSVISPYIWPFAISAIIILVYIMIRFRKIGVFKTLFTYALSVIAAEAVYLSVIAIARIPVNRIIIPIGLLIYTVIITIITAIKENQLSNYHESNSKKGQTKKKEEIEK